MRPQAEAQMFRDMAQMMKQAREMQSKLQELQETLAKREVQGNAGGGMVTVTMNGRSEVLRVHVDPQAAADVEMLEDLLVAAFRDAHAQVQELAKHELGGLAGLLGGMPPL
jgi:nucleoid-associated protein EbfC